MSTLVAAEFLKIRTTRMVWGMIAAIVVITTLSVVAAASGAMPGRDLSSEEGIRGVLHVAGSGAIFVLMFGIIITAGEYRQKTVVDTFLTTPRRIRVLFAKFVAAVSTGIAFGAIAAGVAIVVAAIAYQVRGIDLPLTAGIAGDIFLGAIIYAALFGALGASIGSLIHHQVGAIIGTFAVVVVAESAISAISRPVWRLLPATLGMVVVSNPGGENYSQPVAAGLLLLYAVAIMLLAVAIERRRDA